MVLFILNGILFMLIGLELPQVIHAMPAGSAFLIAKLAVLVLLVIVLVRFVWMFAGDLFTTLLQPNVRRKNRIPWQQTA